MLFRKPEITDIPAVRPFYQCQSPRICDYTVGAVFMWREYFHSEICIEGDILYSRVTDGPGGSVVYQVPVGPGDTAEAIRRIIEEEACLSEETGVRRRFVFSPIEERDLPLFAAQPILFSFDNHNGAYADYVYDYEDFCSLSGKRNHKKKNHINQFERACTDWHYEPVTPEKTEALKEFLNSGYRTAEHPSAAEAAELKAVYEVLSHYEQYGMTGGILFADERIAGFTAGEPVGDMLFIHIEKADKRIPGAYQKLNHEFAMRNGSGIRWINREDDSGDEGLRRSKKSYHPVRMEYKYTAVPVFEQQCAGIESAGE